MNREPEPCKCGDEDCPVCGPLQGYNHRLIKDEDYWDYQDEIKREERLWEEDEK